MKIKLNDDIKIDLPKLIESRLLVQANSGGGKSWAIRRLIEQAFGHVQIIVIDPEGEFGNMRAKFDFVYAGKGGDAPVESRSAALLAHRLLELKASAVVDLYELPPQERKHFVKLFCEAMVNAPKELWHDVLVIIDEAHVFAPEKGESEAMGPVIDLATRGRKRGYCVVLATQRLPKLNKDAAAECNNKLIGRASQDIDRKRAAEELGFTSKEQILSLRDLDPGEFYCFGPAISRDVSRISIGDVQVKPPKRGVARGRVPAPSAHVKQMLGKLKDLPQEAAEEAKTVQELKGALGVVQRQLREATRLSTVKPAFDPEKAPPMGVSQWMNYGVKYGYNKFFESKIVGARDKEWQAKVDMAKKEIGRLGRVIAQIYALSDKEQKLVFSMMPVKPMVIDEVQKITPAIEKKLFTIENKGVDNEELGAIGVGEKAILIALASRGTDGMTRDHITVQTGYKRATRNTYIQRLQQRGYVDFAQDGRVFASGTGVEALGSDYEPLPTGDALIKHHLDRLPEGESRILALLVSDGPKNRDELTEQLGYKRATRNTYIQRLTARGLVESTGNSVSAHHKLV